MRFKKYAEYAGGLQPMIAVPLVNVVFLVMVCAGFWLKYLILPAGMEVQLPRAMTSRAIQGPIVQVSVLDNGSMRLNGQELTIGQFMEFLKLTADRRQTVVINADSRAPWKYVVAVWEAIRASGLADCVMATNP
ncbi:MAG TPA: biopolymer transporter ExbD [Candidatus Omnitrophota bacterium]|nr:biopolymer transporter ExbD [Candidatus Omnitrophota bacterium]